MRFYKFGGVGNVMELFGCCAQYLGLSKSHVSKVLKEVDI